MARARNKTARTTQRHRALDILFEADEKGLLNRQDLLDLLAQRQVLSTAQSPISGFGVEIIRAYAAHIADIDTIIEAASEDWALYRMNTVDRNCIRGAIAEYQYMGTGRGAVINEWVGLVRTLSTDKSVGFVMGVLNRAADIIEEEKSQADHSLSALDTHLEDDETGLLAALRQGQINTPSAMPSSEEEHSEEEAEGKEPS